MDRCCFAPLARPADLSSKSLFERLKDFNNDLHDKFFYQRPLGDLTDVLSELAQSVLDSIRPFSEIWEGVFRPCSRMRD
jgi:hypothetical protein